GLRVEKLQRLPRRSDASESGGRMLNRLTYRRVFIQPLKRNRASSIRIVFEHDMFDVKLRLRKLISVFDWISLRGVANRGRIRHLLRTRIMLRAGRILRTNGNRRAQNYQRGGETMQQ